MDFQNTAYQRWYDKYPNIKSLALLGEHLSDKEKYSVGETLLSIITHHDVEPVKNKHLGAETILKLYKSGLRRRWYDAVPDLHNSFNIILTWPEAQVVEVDQKCKPLVDYIAERLTKKVQLMGKHALFQTDSIKHESLPRNDLLLQNKNAS